MVAMEGMEVRRELVVLVVHRVQQQQEEQEVRFTQGVL